MYDQAEECELKVNDVVEIFGVFELDLEPEGVVPPGADNIQAMGTPLVNIDNPFLILYRGLLTRLSTCTPLR